MTQDVFPEIQIATEALESRIALTEAEVSQMKEDIKAKKMLLRSWRKALAAFNPKRAAPKKRAAGRQPAPELVPASLRETSIGTQRRTPAATQTA